MVFCFLYYRGQGTLARGPGEKQGIHMCLSQVDCSVYEKYPVVAIPCPISYMPVCGSDYITYGNKCLLCTESLWVSWGRRRSRARVFPHKPPLSPWACLTLHTLHSFSPRSSWERKKTDCLTVRLGLGSHVCQLVPSITEPLIPVNYGNPTGPWVFK